MKNTLSFSFKLSSLFFLLFFSGYSQTSTSTSDETISVNTEENVDIEEFTNKIKKLDLDGFGNNKVRFPISLIDDFWSLTGNSNATSSSFLGTTNSEPLRFRVANQERLQITRNGRFHIEYLPLQNLYFGQNAGNENSYLISFNTAFGINALSKNTGAKNTAVGFNALKENTNSQFNTAIGSEALVANTTGWYNTSVGAYSLKANVDGRHNTAMGMQSLNLNVSGNNNTAFGYGTLRRITANNNTAIGYDAGSNFDGLSNVFIGYRSGPLIGAISQPSGNRNIFIGANDFVSGQGFGTIGNNNLYIGSDLQYFNGDNNLNIGDKIYGTGTGSNSAIGIGVPNPQARLHTFGTVRLASLPNSTTLPTNILGTDNLGNVYNFNPNLISSNATITNNLVSTNNTY